MAIGLCKLEINISFRAFDFFNEHKANLLLEFTKKKQLKNKNQKQDLCFYTTLFRPPKKETRTDSGFSGLAASFLPIKCQSRVKLVKSNWSNQIGQIKPVYIGLI